MRSLIVKFVERIFPDDSAQRSFSLAQSQLTTTGAILATYARAAS